jgi:hypothetical protein
MVYLPQDAIIAEAKFTQYLLIPLAKDDKSKFLAQAGYTIDNWPELEQDIRTQILTQAATLIETTGYGEKYEIRASLAGRNGITLNLRTIWIVANNITKFITLVPDKGVPS